MKVLGYIRVSQRRGRQGPSFISPTQQREQIERWAAANDAVVIDLVEEIDESGGRHDRPGLLRCVEAIESGEVDGMVVAKLDRYFRDQLGGHVTMHRIKVARGFLAIPGDGIDTRHETGKMMFGFLLTIAEGQLDRYREMFADARGRAVARGIHISPVPPLGYTRDTDEHGKVTSPLRPDLALGPIVAEVYQRRAAGESLAELARWLERHEIKSVYGGTLWTGRAVKMIIRNRVYLGEARHGQFVNPDAHEPLVDETTWRRAQQPGTAPARRGNKPALLAGLLRCAGCSYGMKNRLAEHGRREYACHRKHAGGTCTAPASTSNPELERLVVAAFFDAAGDMAATAVVDSAAHDDAVQAHDEAVSDLVAYRDDPRVLRAIGHDRFIEGLEVRQLRIHNAEQKLASVTPRQPLGMPPELLRDRWDTFTVVEQNRLLRLAFDCIFLRRGSRYMPIDRRFFICRRGTAPELPAPGMRPTPKPREFVFPDR